MSDKLKFGDYVAIEQRRFGGPNEMCSHKVIGTLSSNSWVDVPARPPALESNHAEMSPVVACVCCGVDERRILRYRVEDVTQETKES